MAVSWGFTMLLIVTMLALFTFSQPVFQLTIPETVTKQTQTDVEMVSQTAAVQNLLRSKPLNVEARKDAAISKASFAWDIILQRGTSRRHQRWTRKLIDRQERQLVRTPRRSVLASFQSDRMVPTGPNPLHNSNRSQVISP